MLPGRSHSVSDLERRSGFDRRTIVYYIQQGLLARPGRRGPNTRYPAETLSRLLFIRGIKELQHSGQLLNVTLADIGSAIASLDPARLQDLLDRGLPVTEIEPLLAVAPGPAPVGDLGAAQAPDPDSAPAPAGVAAPPPAPAPPPRERRAFGLADANVRQRFAPGATRPAATAPSPAAAPPVASPPAAPGPAAPAASPRPPADAVDADLGSLLRELEIRPAMAGRRLLPGASEQWTEIPITSRIFLSVRGLSAEDAPLADSVARALKKLLRAP